MEKQKKNPNKKQQRKHLKIYKIKIDNAKKLGMQIPKESKYIIPIFIPHRGCKNCCIFCNQRKISGELKDVTEQDVKNKIEEYLPTFKDKTKTIEIAFFGGSFTGLELEEQEKFLKVAHEYIENKKVNSIKLSTRPDYISPKILELLKKYDVQTIELGVQSMDEEVLKIAKRGHTSKDVINASKLIKQYGFKLGHQVMVGLPGSTKSKELETVRESIELKPDVIRIYPVYTLRDSELYDMYKNKSYIPLSLEETIDRVKDMYTEYINNNINVIRVGLQVTDEICQSNDDIKGPVCDNYKERILSEIMYDKMNAMIGKAKCNIMYKLKKPDIIKIIVPKKQLNYAIGNNKVNIIRLIKNNNINIVIKYN